MASSYESLVANVRAWSNRDAEVLPDTIIQDALSYAADYAYKQLKIPAFESTINYSIVSDDTIITTSYSSKIISANTGVNKVELNIPSDLSSFIHLRIVESGSEGKQGVVFNEKTDVRTFHDMYADKYSGFYWARQGAKLILAGDISVGDVIELHYYRRLPALNARYNITAANYNSNVITPAAVQPTSGIVLYFEHGTSYPPIPGVDIAYDMQNLTNTREEFYFAEEAGQEIANWLRDENRRVVLFGALHQCFDYLSDDVQSQKYKLKFMEAIDELNQEEKQRKASGGNIQMHFNSQLI